MKLTQDTTLKDLFEYEPLKPAADYLVGCADKRLFEQIAGDSFVTMNQNAPTWSIKDMLYGMNRLLEVVDSGVDYLHTVYPDEAILKEPQKADVKLFYLPPNSGEKKTDKYVVLCSGGAYRNVCNPQEGFPVAARLNELGFTVFALDYRTWSPSLSASGVASAALEDVAAALRYIDDRADRFGVKAGAYAMGGFSAGGNLAALWGTKENGYEAYGLPKPEVLLLDYALVNCDPLDTMSHEVRANYEVFAGANLTQERLDAISVIQLVDQDYPATVLAHCEDDDLVSFDNNWVKMAEVLDQHQVPVLLKRAKTGGHGYGLGSETALSGWIDEAVAFWIANGLKRYV